MRTLLVVAAVVVENGRVLVTQRKAGTHLAGAWEFPGGKLLPGEDPRVGLKRELREELGIDAAVGEIVEVTFHEYPDADKAVLLMFFEAERTADSAPPEALDVAAFAWFGAGDLDPARFPPADVGVIAKAKRRLSD